jgi:general secretion pathway protein A
MQEAYWGLNEPPFALAPDPKTFYMGHAGEDVLMMLHYAVTRNKGAALLTGALGMGKTALCHKLIDLLDPIKTQTISIVNPMLSPLQLHLELLGELGVKVRFKDRPAVAKELQKRLLDLYEKGKKVVLVVDDAHQIQSDGTFEELRQLLNLQVDDQFLVTIILAGLPILAQNLSKFPELDQIMAVRVRLQPLTLVETGDLIMHRLRVAGYTGDPGIFSPDAVLELHRFTQGVPRLVCHLADHALMLGKNEKAPFVDGLLMHEAIAEFYGEEEHAA